MDTMESNVESTNTNGPKDPNGPQGPTPHQKTEPLPIVSLVTGICGIVFAWVPILGFLASVAGIVTGIIGLVRRQVGRGLAIAGIVTGGVGIVIGIALWLFFALAMAIGFSQGVSG